jgi:hypothetical protein
LGCSKKFTNRMIEKLSHCLDCYKELTTGLEVYPICGAWYYDLKGLMEWE